MTARIDGVSQETVDMERWKRGIVLHESEGVTRLRLIAILAMRIANGSCADIARVLKISRQRVDQLLCRAEAENDRKGT